MNPDSPIEKSTAPPCPICDAARCHRPDHRWEALEKLLNEDRVDGLGDPGNWLQSRGSVTVGAGQMATILATAEEALRVGHYVCQEAGESSHHFTNDLVEPIGRLVEMLSLIQAASEGITARQTIQRLRDECGILRKG